MVNFFGDGGDLLLDAQIQVIGELEVVRFFAESDNFFGQGFAAFAALCPYFGKSNINAEFLTFGFYEVELCLGVGRESVDRDAAGKTEYVFDVSDMLEKVRKTLLKSFQVLVVQFSFRNAAVILQRTYGSYDNNS